MGNHEEALVLHQKALEVFVGLRTPLEPSDEHLTVAASFDNF
jgi:hypothetical protein